MAGEDRLMDYSLPRKVDEKEYITTIDLTDTTLEQRRLAANRTTTFGLETFGEPQSEEFVIAAADLHRSGFKDEHLRIITIDEAVQHPVQFHVSKNSNQLVIRYLDTAMQQIEMLQTKFVDLRNSVANEHNEKPEGYLLPSALVKAAEKFFQILFTSQYSVKSLCAGLL
ncbi:hypothetical protein J4E91_010236 [Alternaria rosae]|nr:hypothetical protein J4E91_010236 [Alternaria rosae]